jgi:hypothetical protein
VVADVTPADWAPVAFRGVQISVPDDWWIASDRSGPCAEAAPGLVTVGEVGPLSTSSGCEAPPDAASITTLTQLPSQFAAGRPTSVNGVPVVLGAADASLGTYYVPSLGVEIVARGTQASRVLRTVTHSPLAVVQAPGPASSVPSDWQHITFSGIELAVPATWAVHRQGWPFCEVGIPVDTAWFDQFDAPVVVPGCPMIPEVYPPTAASAAARLGVALSTGRYAITYQHQPQRCAPRNGLRVCTAVVSGPGLQSEQTLQADTTLSDGEPVVMQLGLGGNGVVARTILDSLHPA